MIATKIVMLAALAALSVGISTAMAQEGASERSSQRVALATTRPDAQRSGSLDGTDASNWGDPPQDYTSGRGCPPCH